MKIAEVSKRYGISADTLRYYERIGILREIPRTKTGIRDYNEENCKTIEFVKQMRSAGMSIECLTQYIDLMYQGDATKSQRKELLIKQRDLIKDHIAELEESLDRLDRAVDSFEDCASSYSM